MKIKKITLFLIIILITGLAGWGFFSVKNKNQPLVYENNAKREVETKKEEVIDSIDSQSTESVSQPEAEKEETVEIKEEIKEEKKIENEVDEDKSEKKSESSLDIKDKLVSWGFSPSKERKIDAIILHSSYNVLGGDEYDFDKIILEYKQYGVAPHYVIDRKGKIFRLVKDNNIAYHAGESKVPDGRTGVNNFSIGIEIVNSEKDNFTSNQYAAINELIAFLKDEYKIKYVLGHDQIAPGRKTDPWNINWEKINK